MKNFNEQIQRFVLIRMKKNYSTNINVKRKINWKKDINDSKNEIKNNTINKNTIKTNSLTSKSNFINKKTPINKSDKFSRSLSIGLISPNFSTKNKPSEYFSLKKKNEEIINEISKYKFKIKLIDEQIMELKNYINKKNMDNINDNTIKSLNVTITEDNIKNNN
jgi:hypothetical protein